MTTEVRDNPAAHRFELEQDGVVAFITYERRGEAVALIHTEVPKALEGRGIASRLTSEVLERLRDEGAKVVPECSFVSGYMQRHPETRDLLS